MKRSIAALALTTSLVLATGAFAQTLDKVVKVGSLGDQSGLYADIGGPGSTVAAQMAIEDSGLLAKGWKIEVIAADHQNKPDVAASLVRQWFDQGVLAAIDVPTSSVALAVAQIAKDKDRIMLNASATSTALTSSQMASYLTAPEPTGVDEAILGADRTLPSVPAHGTEPWALTLTANSTGVAGA